jgi:hypothetical protein
VDRLFAAERVTDALGVPDGFEVLPGGNVDPGDVLVVAQVLSPGQEARDLLLERDVHARIGIPVTRADLVHATTVTWAG